MKTREQKIAEFDVLYGQGWFSDIVDNSDDTAVVVVPQPLDGESKPLNRLVIIHDTDADGICAAWCINKGFKDEYSSVLLIPQRSGENTIPDGLTENDSVYMVDRTYPWDTLIQLSQQVFSVTVIDHHKSAMDEYKNTEAYQVGIDSECLTLTASSLLFDYGNITVHIDTTHSACMLSHMWVLEHGISSDTSLFTPWFVSYIEDRDIWKWALPNSKEINAGLHYCGHNFTNYDQYAEDPLPSRVSTTVAGIYSIGVIVLQTQLNIIRSIAHGPTVRFTTVKLSHDNKETRYAILCCPFTLVSDLGNYILHPDNSNAALDMKQTKQPIPDVGVVLCYNSIDKGFTYSIRSKHDTLWLAKMFDGGGHALASGFSSSIPPAKLLDYVREKLTPQSR